jgi:hypothetical protein
VRVNLGQTRSRTLIAELAALGFGECVSRKDCLPPRRLPWFLDNGAYGDWRSGIAFDDEAFLSKFRSPHVDAVPPDFIVCPDRVATGLESLAFSLHWRDRCESLRPGRRYYFVVQDGMAAADVAPVLDGFVGVFVGGSSSWKIKTARAWTRFAHERGLPIHVGRAGTADKAAWCQRIGVDSFDSSQPLWGTACKARFLRGIARAAHPQAMLDLDTDFDSGQG